jgi:hypothetical protein
MKAALSQTVISLAILLAGKPIYCQNLTIFCSLAVEGDGQNDFDIDKPDIAWYKNLFSNRVA